jgi:endonuclease/exonuclease/phosphatase family metal-dependent hydrolase
MVKLICYNIEYCEGIPGKWYQYLNIWRTFHSPKKLEKRIIKEIKKLNPDVLALVEVDIGSIRAHFHDEAKSISNSIGLKNIVEKVKYPLKGWISLFYHIPILDKQANAIMSKYRLSDIKYHVLNEGAKRVVIESTIKYKKPVTLLLAHLSLGRSARKKQIHELIKIVKGINHEVILMGDFNTFDGENEIKELLMRTHLNDRIYLDRADLHLTEPTFHPVRRLDYILTSGNIKVKDYRILKFPFSDHLPLMIDFDVK